MPNMDYVVYDKDLTKDIGEKCLVKYKGKVKLEISRSIPFQVVIPLSKIKNENAIQDDRLLKTKIRKVTDPTYTKLLDDLAKEFGSLHYKEVLGTVPAGELDRIWDVIQKKAEIAGKKIGSDAVPVLKKYLVARNQGKVASFNFKYKRFKCGLAVAGAVGGSAVAVIGAASASAATMGAASAGLVLAGAGGARAITGSVREYKRQTKDMVDTQKSIQKTIDLLRSSISAQQKKEKSVTGKELLAKMSSAWFETNIRSIKKLENDIDLLEQQAKKRVLKASKYAAHAAEFHERKKEFTRTHEALTKTLEISKKHLRADPAIRQLIPKMEQEEKTLKRSIKAAQSTRDLITSDAAQIRKEARNIIKAEVPRLRNVATGLKAHRQDIGWTAYPIKLLPAAVDLIVGSAGASAPMQTVAEQAESLQDLVVTAGGTVVEIAETMDERFNILKRALG